MNFYFPAAFAFLVAALVPSPRTPPPAPHYHWTKGQTLRFLIQRDPYFADPKAAMETVNPDAPYRAPIVERLTEKVQAVASDGTATLLLTLRPEPGFEDEDNPQPTLTRTVTVTPAGEVQPLMGTTPESSPAERDLLCGLAPLPPVSAVRPDGLAVTNQSLPTSVSESTSPDHDGTLLQTTQVAGSEHRVFDCRRGQLIRTLSTMTVTMSLIMTKRGRRGSDDFGHVIPSVQVVQTLSVERQPD